MCLLQDLRSINIVATSHGLVGYDTEVDEFGHATVVTGIQTLGQANSAWNIDPLPHGYWCAACGQLFDSWEEARSHLEDLDQ
jgi:hypothetical protein